MTMLRGSDGVPLQSVGGRQLYMLDAPLYFMGFMVPGGFITDLSSIPRLPFIYLLLNGISDLPGVLHDFLYSTGLVAREVADAILREACLAIGVPRWKANLIYAGVRLGGASSYEAQ